MSAIDDIDNRLYNWKFSQAAAYLHNKDVLSRLNHDDVAVIRALAIVLSNSGWFDGGLSTLVNYIVITLHEKLVPPPKTSET